MIGTISQIQKFSVNDGDGIRTTIFLSGCPLRCKWCCNPETWDMLQGKMMSVAEVIEQINRDFIYFRESGGGITFSGGEPTLQKDFLKALVEELYDLGINMAIESSGSFEFKDFADIIEKLDLIFIDIKHMDPIIHEELTGISNAKTLENIKKIGSMDKELVIRIPLIKGINDDEKNIQNTAVFVRQYVMNPKIELLPYHNLGEHKYRDLGLNQYIYKFETPSKEDSARAKAIIENEKVEVVDYK